jgi:hypothetical protein
MKGNQNCMHSLAALALLIESGGPGYKKPWKKVRLQETNEFNTT